MLIILTMSASEASSDGRDEWSSRYGEIVFAKASSFPWWPSYIVDPYSLEHQAKAMDRGIASIGKSYTVCFYGDNSIGFVLPKNIVPFNDENKAKFAKQSLGRYAHDYQGAVEAAEQELRSLAASESVPQSSATVETGADTPNEDRTVDGSVDGTSSQAREDQPREPASSASLASRSRKVRLTCLNVFGCWMGGG